MNFDPGNFYHVYNQGNNRQRIFFTNEDYLIFLRLYKRLISPVADTVAWCLMPNHFHFMLHTDEKCAVKLKQGGVIIDPVSNGFRKLLSSYAKIINSQKDRSGSLFRQKTKAKCLNDIPFTEANNHDPDYYLLNCFRYIHQNPLKANLVTRLENWEYSSFKDYAGLRNGTLCSKELATLYCNYKPSSFIEETHILIAKECVGLLK